VPYRPAPELLERYADVLVNFALRGGKGIRRGDVVLISAGEPSKPLYIAVRDAVLRAGGTYIASYAPEGASRGALELATAAQIETFHHRYYRGLAAQIDHQVTIRATDDPHELEGLDTSKVVLARRTGRPYRQWLDAKETAGRYSWTVGLYGTRAMAKEARLSLAEYWRQIAEACFLDDADPIRRWRETWRELARIKRRLDRLEIEALHVEGDGVDLRVAIGAERRWLGATGHNIPSFEVFTTPDWRGTEGSIAFTEPLYRYGSLIEGIRLRFERGRAVEASATRNEALLQAMVATDGGACRVGEVSLTDGRFSPITRFMADTLYDENRGGPEGNFHLALGNAYKAAFTGEGTTQSKRDWQRLGFNESSIHTDIVSTARREVSATFANGRTRAIYRDGRFLV
jgi:aminopeptidase